MTSTDISGDPHDLASWVKKIEIKAARRAFLSIFAPIPPSAHARQRNKNICPEIPL